MFWNIMSLIVLWLGCIYIYKDKNTKIVEKLYYWLTSTCIVISLVWFTYLAGEGVECGLSLDCTSENLIASSNYLLGLHFFTTFLVISYIVSKNKEFLLMKR